MAILISFHIIYNQASEACLLYQTQLSTYINLEPFQTSSTRGGGGAQSPASESHLQHDAGRVLHPQRGRHHRVPWLRHPQDQQGQEDMGAVQ